MNTSCSTSSPRGQAADDVSEVIDWVAGVVGDAGGEVLSVNNWGRRRLAYPIDHEFEGNYVFTTLSLSAESTGAVESALTISEDVIRHLLIRGIIPSDGSPPPSSSVSARARCRRQRPLRRLPSRWRKCRSRKRRSRRKRRPRGMPSR